MSVHTKPHRVKESRLVAALLTRAGIPLGYPSLVRERSPSVVRPNRSMRRRAS